MEKKPIPCLNNELPPPNTCIVHLVYLNNKKIYVAPNGEKDFCTVCWHRNGNLVVFTKTGEKFFIKDVENLAYIVE